MKSPRRIARYLRVIAGEVAEAKGELLDFSPESIEVIKTLDAVGVKLRDGVRE